MLFFSSGIRVAAEDFIRGDANGDGKISLADAYTVLGDVFFGTLVPGCENALDADDSGRVDLGDTLHLFYYLSGTSLQPKTFRPPFPGVGPDPTPNVEELTCVSYGGNGPLEDPAARIEILEAVAAGGGDNTAVITIALSHTAQVAGYQATLDIAGNPIGGYQPSGFDPLYGTPRFDPPEDLTPPPESGPVYSYVSPRAGRLEIGYLRLNINEDGWGTGWLDPAQSTPVLRFTVCLEDGTAAGEYPIALTAGSLVDAGTGKSISPQLTEGTLVVQKDVNTGIDCFVPKPPVCPPPAGKPEELSATYRLGDTSAGPGQTARVPFSILANADTQGFLLSIDYDEAVVEGLGLQVSWRKPDNTPFGFLSYGFYNDDATPGNGGVDEGYFYAVGVFSMTDNCNNITANRETEVLRLEFRVRPEAPAGSTGIRFLDGARQLGPPPGRPIANQIRAFAQDIPASVAGSFIFINSVLSVLPDGSAFRRGDSNLDDQVDLSDAVYTLGHLFLEGTDLGCPDAADANDDGTLDISDPVITLGRLFLGGAELPPPGVERGKDPTPDSLGCYRTP